MPHIHEKIDYAADVFIVNDDAVLLRMHEKYAMWLAPGGHVELDEDFVEAALREAQEETGLPIVLLGPDPVSDEGHERELRIPRFINRHNVNDTHEHISFVYFATTNTRETNPAPGEKSDGFQWFTERELDEPAHGVKLRIRHYAKEALRAARLSTK
jgi:8-oxo-dGTP pyrophosphatase MutT (NUDIX family)